MLNQPTRDWFTANLGPPRPAEQLGPTYDPEAALRNEDGSLDGGALTAAEAPEAAAEDLADEEVEEAVQAAVVDIAAQAASGAGSASAD